MERSRLIPLVKGPWRVVPLLVVLGCSVAYSQTTAPSDSPLGHTHLWINLGRMDLSGAATDAWGVDHEGYVGLEAYHISSGGDYFGGGIGRSSASQTTNADGDTIRDFRFLWLELNNKWAFTPKRGWTFDAGLGAALFYVDGQEVSVLGGQEVTDPLADLGFGVQVFGDFTWRVRRLLLGLNAEYQLALDLLDMNYSNLRFGAHLGVAF